MTLDLDIEESPPFDLRFALIYDSEAVWPHQRDDGASDFDAEDVLSFLSDAWSSLQLVDSWPPIFAPNEEPRSMTGVLRAAEDRWDRLGEADADKIQAEEQRIQEFLALHNLAEMKPGADLQVCLVRRIDRKMLIETHGQLYECDADRFFCLLVDIGDHAAAILERRTGVDHPLIAGWRRREEVDPITMAARLTGLPRAALEKNPRLLELLADDVGGRAVSEVANDNRRPVLAAARGSAALGPNSAALVLEHVKQEPDGEVAVLADLHRRIQLALRDVANPTDYGARCAQMIRDLFQIAGDAFLDLHELSNRLRVSVKEIEFPDPGLDGVATLGPEHGPAILLNALTRRHGASATDLERSLRFTWAHEIGHLLIDRDERSALIDSVRQRTPRSIETRANAFAAYLLLPLDDARRQWEAAGRPLGWDAFEAFLNELTEKRGAPRIMAARQVARSVLDPERRQLEELIEAYIER